jgi:hypothetical protein
VSAARDSLRRSGIALAPAGNDILLPVIDFGHPRFAVPDDEATLDQLRRDAEAADRRYRMLPGFLFAWLLRRAARTSRFVSAMIQPRSTYLDGISTYAMKLGADNLLPPFDGAVDRRFAASAQATLLRLRMQQTAHLVAAAAQRAGCPPRFRSLHLVDIGGGPAMDAINAVLLLARGSPDFRATPIHIHVLDREEDGASFGRAALAALQREGGPLAGMDVDMTWQAYDWNETSGLERLVGTISTEGGTIVASSEGALFEYGSDEAIVRNLEILAAAGHGARAVVGSVTRADLSRRRSAIQSRLALVPRGLDGFAPLAARAGFRITEARDAVLSHQVMLSWAGSVEQR